ncbi:MAG TPA: G1 family glutamic endopeptidase [Acidimicrobiales bacterium]|nr:G1 family glutamic endopeptidase [Acidimicrobiales bacterium]
MPGLRAVVGVQRRLVLLALRRAGAVFTAGILLAIGSWAPGPWVPFGVAAPAVLVEPSSHQSSQAWSGYEERTTIGEHFTLAAASFTVPRLRCDLAADRRSRAAFWVGIGGETVGIAGSTEPLGQVGVEAACSQLDAGGDPTSVGAPSYVPFWETWCHDAVVHPRCAPHLDLADSAHPGDQIDASVEWRHGRFEFTLVTTPPGKKPVTVWHGQQAPCPVVDHIGCQRASAEVIAERPTGPDGKTLAPYAPFGSVLFWAARWAVSGGNGGYFCEMCGNGHFQLDQSPGMYVAPTNPNLAHGAFVVGQDTPTTQWELQKANAVFPPSTLDSVYPYVQLSCYDADHCMAVGTTESGAPTRPVAGVAAVWDGISWAPATPPTPAHADMWQLDAVSCPYPNFCVVVGSVDNNTPLLETWDDGTWTEAKPPPSPFFFNDFTALSCVSAADCVAIGTKSDRNGGGAAYVKGGKFWTEDDPSVPGATSLLLQSVSCEQVGQDCVAVGRAADNVSQRDAVILRLAGSKWTRERSAYSSGYFTGVSCVSGFCIAVGQDREADLAYSEVTTGDGWQKFPLPPSAEELTAVQCAAPYECIAVGYAHTATSLAPYSYQLDGGKWTGHALPTPSGTFSWSPNSLSCAQDGACMAAGTAEQKTTYDLVPVVVDNFRPLMSAFP